jgi:[ribosomal protein S5]-alanine N-acetyltransferase
MLKLIPLTSEVTKAVADEAKFTRLTGARLGAEAELVRSVVAQGEAHRAATGGTTEWGGFLAVDEAHGGQVIGTCAFVGAPDEEGEVEIAYFSFPAYEGQGYGTAMAGALVERAEASGKVRVLYAHTLPEENPSTRILAANGFRQAGTAHDDEVGEVWRWERGVQPDDDGT